ncbi:hypothetical protein ZIOFF_039386 [Zingiber officinale]|uniref:Uncharacterized protein n=1 Tax=Zingiber officinale TaxID=94328 RepID=A0A8J5G4F4_ZINOF|nr:hypothetical protein ZIOFF_039386 [Zingiber officinale]
MDRWRKDIKRGYQSITNIYDEYVCERERHRYNILTPLIQEVQQLGANNDDGCSVLVEILKDAKEKLIAIQLDHSRADQLKEASTSSSKTIHSPLKVRSRGRPPTKRKQSKIEQIMKKSVAKARRKVHSASAPQVVYAPSLMIGAALGAVFGGLAVELINSAIPGNGVVAQPQAYALVGMAATLASVCSVPLTSVLLLFELTKDYRILLQFGGNMMMEVISNYLNWKLTFTALALSTMKCC